MLCFIPIHEPLLLPFLLGLKPLSSNQEVLIPLISRDSVLRKLSITRRRKEKANDSTRREARSTSSWKRSGSMRTKIGTNRGMSCWVGKGGHDGQLVRSRLGLLGGRSDASKER